MEELYKVSKQLLQIESFHGRSERTVKQEVYAHFARGAVAVVRHRVRAGAGGRSGAAGPAPQRANFNHSLGTVARELEGLFLNHAALLRETLDRVLAHVARSPQRERPDRSYPRRSLRPSKKWRDRKPADPDIAD